MEFKNNFVDKRKYKNGPENDFATRAREIGWIVTKKGWPDFICYKPDGSLVFVEVKPNVSNGLKKAQHKFMNTVNKKYGIPCYRWSPDNDWITDKNV